MSQTSASIKYIKNEVLQKWNVIEDVQDYIRFNRHKDILLKYYKSF